MSSSITEFTYDPESDETFPAWYLRFEDVFRIDGKILNDATRVRLLPDGDAHSQAICRFYPIMPPPVMFLLKKRLKLYIDVWPPNVPLHRALQMPEDEKIGPVNRDCQRIQLASLTEDHFKCRMFVCDLQSPEDANIRMQLFNKIEKEDDVTIPKLVAECNRFLSLKRDTEMVESASATDSADIATVARSQHKSNIADVANQHNQQTGPNKNPKLPAGSAEVCIMYMTVHTRDTHVHYATKLATKRGFLPVALHLQEDPKSP
ncbi:unnamed protein product [Soboliphyme baturini]|uniref:DUF7083 domain-containing protein n=1 Tax=Soboliphyme baturini TaxID=241478 RepID=A0A3P8C7C8_9BILA|nr:unnamed protein product [Soboliphyme baturini]